MNTGLAESQQFLIRNFCALLKDFDYTYEMEIIGVQRWKFLQRKRMIREFESLYIALWHLALTRSFPQDHEEILQAFLCSRCMGGCSEQRKEHIMQYVDKLRENGDSNFTVVSHHFLSLINFEESTLKAMNLKIALHVRNVYKFIFDRLL